MRLVLLALLVLIPGVAQAEVLAADNFNRADTSGTLNSVADGLGRWYAHMSNLEISGNLVQCNSGQACNQVGAHSVYDYTFSNGFVGAQSLDTVEADPNSRIGAIICRAPVQEGTFGSAASDFYIFYEEGGAIDWRLQNITNGTTDEESIDTVDPTVATNPRLVLQCNGDTVTGFQNGVQTHSVTFTLNLKNSGRAGFYNASTNTAGENAYDNFVVTSTSAAEADDCVLSGTCVASVAGAGGPSGKSLLGVGQ